LTQTPFVEYRERGFRRYRRCPPLSTAIHTREDGVLKIRDVEFGRP
jgi:hypothetical protein